MTSVVIPVRNGAKYIEDALDSVFRQSFSDLEVIVVDDGSTDGTPEILAGYGDRIRRYRGQFGSASAARNKGIDESRGELIAFLDADDIWLPYKLDVQRRVMERLGATVGFVFSDFSLYRDQRVVNASQIKQYFQIFRQHRVGFDDLFDRSISFEEAGIPGQFPVAEPRILYGRIYDKLCLGNFLITGTMLFRRDVLARHRFAEDLPVMEDYELGARVAKEFEAAYVDLPTQLYRQHEDQLTGDRHQLDLLLCASKIVKRVWEADTEFYATHRRTVDRVVAVTHWALGHYYLSRFDLDNAVPNLKESILRNPLQARVYASYLAAAASRRAIGLLTRGTGP